MYELKIAEGIYNDEKASLLETPDIYSNSRQLQHSATLILKKFQMIFTAVLEKPYRWLWEIFISKNYTC